MHVFIWSVFHSFINKASDAVTLKGISRQAIWLLYFILNYLADASNEMWSIVAERQGEGERESAHNSFSGITINLCYFFLTPLMTSSPSATRISSRGGN